MTPADLAAIHGSAFIQDRGWSAPEFTDLLTAPYTKLFVHKQGFALTRTIAGESELLTIAVDPEHQRKGIAQTLLSKWLSAIQSVADTAFLEVAADNYAARALYGTFHFRQMAIRPAYYQRKNAPSVDALILRRDLTLGQTGDSMRPNPESG